MTTLQKSLSTVFAAIVICSILNTSVEAGRGGKSGRRTNNFHRSNHNYRNNYKNSGFNNRHQGGNYQFNNKYRRNNFQYHNRYKSNSNFRRYQGKQNTNYRFNGWGQNMRKRTQPSYTHQKGGFSNAYQYQAGYKNNYMGKYYVK